MQIKAVHPQAALTLRREGEVLSVLAPFYPGEEPAGTFRLPPVAFDARIGDTVFLVDLQAHLSREDRRVQLTAKLENGLQLLSGEAATPFDTCSQLSVPVLLDLDPAGFVGLRGESVLWERRLGSAGDRIARQRLEMEMYFLRRDPRDAFPRGLPVEALRQVAAGLEGRNGGRLEERGGRFGYPATLADEGSTVAGVIQQVFSFNPPRYDTFQGAPHFTSFTSFNDITLRYGEYLEASKDPHSLLSCYDTASVAQYELRAIGEENLWAYMKPFGYLPLTPLIGRGLCNNPFYGSDDPRRMVWEQAPNRTAFGNHAFCLLEDGNTIGDPCYGPHLGNESPVAYVEVATDDETPQPPKVRRGTVGDITVYQGVTTVINTDLRRDILDSENAEAFRRAVGFGGLEEGERGAPPLSRCWPEPLQCPGLGEGWEAVFRDLLPGLPESHRHWRLRRGGECLTLTLYAASDGAETARRRFQILGSLHQSQGPIFERGPRDLGDISARYPGGARLLWTFRSATFDLRCYGSSIDLEEVARWLQEIAESGEPGGEAPEIDELIPSSETVRLDQLLKVEVVGAEGAVVGWDGAHGGLRLLEEEGRLWTFRAVARVARPITFVAVDPKTLLASKAALEVEITG